MDEVRIEVLSRGPSINTVSVRFNDADLAAVNRAALRAGLKRAVYLKVAILEKVLREQGAYHAEQRRLAIAPQGGGIERRRSFARREDDEASAA